jgi:hypothetical protein
VLAASGPALGRQDGPRPAGPSPEEIASAVAEVKRDPNLGGERTMKTLRWIEQNEPDRKTSLGWLSWIAGLFGWFSQSARYLMWAGAAALAAWIAVFLSRALRTRPQAPEADTFAAPTHVRDLDIRPESLPPNIGRAAAALWDKGEHRAALSLLYRGLLSRLTHVHRVPITDSSTEGDCLALVTGRVPPQTHAYASQLIDAWRHFVYGGTATDTVTVRSLCDDFARSLDRGLVPEARRDQS